MANTYTDLLKLRMPALGDIGWDDEINDNTQIFEFTVAPVLKGNRIVSGLAPSDGGGLDIDVAAGTVVVDGNVYTLTDDSKTCTGSDKNYLFVDNTGTLQCTTTFPVGSFTAIALIDTDAASIIRFSDARALAQGALAMAIDYSPQYYELDTGEDEDINQHLSGIDSRIEVIGGQINYWENGNLKVWQRKTSQTGNGVLSADRLYFASTGAAHSVSRQAFTIGQTDVSGEPQYYLRNVVTAGSAAGDYSQAVYKLLDVRTLANRNQTNSFYAKADSSKNIAVTFYQYFGSGGSTQLVISTETISLTSSWNRYFSNISWPSISGKTLGTLSASWVVLWFDAGTDLDSVTNSLGHQSGTFDFAQFQLEDGDMATAPIYRSFDDTFWDCLPYYCKSFPYAQTPGDAVSDGQMGINPYLALSSSGAASQNNIFPRELITTPGITIYQPAGVTGAAGLPSYYNGSTWAAMSSLSTTLVNSKAFTSFANGSFTAGYSYLTSGLWVADTSY